MAATTFPTTIDTTATTSTAKGRRPLLRAGVRYGALAAVATTAVAVAAKAIGVSLEADGEAFPILAFAQMTLLCTFVGVGVAKLARTRRRFTTTAVALVALSFVPDLTLAATDTATRLALMLTHVVAAAIVIPALRARLAD
jgi:hypothetical protein